MLNDWRGCDADTCFVAFHLSDAQRRTTCAFSSQCILFSVLCFTYFTLFSSFLCLASLTQPLSIGFRTLRTSSLYRFTKIQPKTFSIIRSSILSHACIASLESILFGRIASDIRPLYLKSRIHISICQALSAFRHALRWSL